MNAERMIKNSVLALAIGMSGFIEARTTADLATATIVKLPIVEDLFDYFEFKDPAYPSPGYPPVSPVYPPVPAPVPVVRPVNDDIGHATQISESFGWSISDTSGATLESETIFDSSYPGYLDPDDEKDGLDSEKLRPNSLSAMLKNTQEVLKYERVTTKLYEYVDPLSESYPGSGNTIWWVWKAPTNETMEFTTEGSAIDTVMGIYRIKEDYLNMKTTASVADLIEEGANDDYNGNSYSGITFSPVKGNTYFICVAGKNGQEGEVVLSWQEIK